MSDTLPCAPVLLTLAALDRGQEEKGTLDVHFARNSVLWHCAGRSRSAEVGEMQKSPRSAASMSSREGACKASEACRQLLHAALALFGSHHEITSPFPRLGASSDAAVRRIRRRQT